MKKIISTEFSEHIKSFKLAMNDLSSQIEEAANLCIKSINNGGKIILITISS